ncbi:hypothetical protein [Enterobacter genomosp. O]|nr:hypothetical protein [Enterobacter genomosp. O]
MATIPSFNIPVVSILLLMGIDHFIDMGRSVINVLVKRYDVKKGEA